MSIDPAQISVKRKPQGVRGGFCYCQADAQDGIGAQLGLVWRPIQRQQLGVDRLLVCGIPAEQRIRDGSVDVGNCFCHTFAEISSFVAIS